MSHLCLGGKHSVTQNLVTIHVFWFTFPLYSNWSEQLDLIQVIKCMCFLGIISDFSSATTRSSKTVQMKFPAVSRFIAFTV